MSCTENDEKAVLRVQHERETLDLTDKYVIGINHFLPAQRNHIFNDLSFFHLHSNSARDVYAQLLRASDGAVCATAAFYYEAASRTFVSPRRGTYGGFTINGPLARDVVERFVITLIGFLRRQGPRQIEVKCAPLSHEPSQLAIICNILLRNGSTLSGHELSYDMQVDDTPFIDHTSDGNAKRIRKCVREGFIAEQVPSVLYDEVYRLIADNRQRRGFPTTMTLSQLQRMVAIFPDRLHYFAVFKNESRAEMVAGAVCISITDSILYVLYWGDIAGVQQYSPVTLLASCIYDFCRTRGVHLFDVGTSTVMGEPNDGLIRFKRALGFSESLKFTFRLQEAA